MPPPVYRLGIIVEAKFKVPARICLKRGYKKTSLSPGRCLITEIARNEEYWHDQELSDGYTYRLQALERDNLRLPKKSSFCPIDKKGAVRNIWLNT